MVTNFLISLLLDLSNFWDYFVNQVIFCLSVVYEDCEIDIKIRLLAKAGYSTIAKKAFYCLSNEALLNFWYFNFNKSL